MRIAMMAAAALAITPAGALAQTGDHDGSREILRGDYARAEQVIAKSRRLFPMDADLMLNLAAVYSATARADAARDLYRTVLAMPDQEVMLASGHPRWSRALASAGLRRVPSVTVASR